MADIKERERESLLIYSKYTNNYRILDGKGSEEVGFSSKRRGEEPTEGNLDATFEIVVNPSSKAHARKAMTSMIKEKFSQELLSINKVLSYLGCQPLTKEELINSVAGKSLE